MEDFQIIDLYHHRNEQAINETSNKYGGQKYQWSDWAVILRRASQNQWGKQTKHSKGNPNKKPPVPCGSSNSIPDIDLERRAAERLQREYEQEHPELQKEVVPPLF